MYSDSPTSLAVFRTSVLASMTMPTMCFLLLQLLSSLQHRPRQRRPLLRAPVLRQSLPQPALLTLFHQALRLNPRLL